MIYPTQDDKLPNLVSKPLPTPNSNKLSPVESSSRLSETYQKFKALNSDTEIKYEMSKRMSETNRVGILKALSQYANKLYTSLGISIFFLDKFCDV